MKFIATDVSDTKRKMVDMAATQLGKPGVVSGARISQPRTQRLPRHDRHETL